MVDWIVRLMVGWMNNWLVVDWFVGMLVGWSVGWLM